MKKLYTAIKAKFKRMNGFSIPVVAGGVQWKDDPLAELANRKDNFAASARQFKPTVIRLGDKIYFGVRIPNLTPFRVNVRKVLLWLTTGRSLCKLMRYVQPDGVDAHQPVTSWELPANLAGLWLIPYRDQAPAELLLKNVEIEYEIILADGSAHVASLKINEDIMHPNTRTFFSDWTHKVTGSPLIAISQSIHSPDSVDMAHEEKNR